MRGKNHKYAHCLCWVSDPDGKSFYPSDLHFKRAEIFELTGDWERAAAICRGLISACNSDQHRSGRAESLLSGIAHKQDDNKTALDMAMSAYRHFEGAGDLFGRCFAMGQIADVHKESGDHKQSLELYRAQYDESLKLGDHKSLIKSVRNIGIISLRKGRYKEAIDYFGEDLKLCRGHGDLYGEGLALGNLGLAYWRMGDLDKAMSHFHAKLEISVKLGDKQSIAYALGNMGLVLFSREDYLPALERFKEQLNILDKMGDQRGKMYALGNICAIYVNQGDYEKALSYGNETLRISEETGNKNNIVIALTTLGIVLKSLGRLEQAHGCFARSLDMSRMLEQPYDICFNLYCLAEVTLQDGNASKAVEYNAQALTIAREIGDRELLFNSELLSAKLEYYSDAGKAAAMLLELSGRYGNLAEQADIFFELRSIIPGEGYHEKAVELYRQLSQKANNKKYHDRFKELIKDTQKEG